jgi:hypothetical protein
MPLKEKLSLAGDRKFTLLFVLAFCACMLCWILRTRLLVSDEGIWDYIGWLWTRGILPYAGVVENKFPAVFYIYYLSNLLFGCTPYFGRAIALLAVLAAAFPVCRMGGRLGGKSGALGALMFYTLLISSPLAQPAVLATTESFFIPFTALAFLIYSRAGEEGSSAAEVFASGACCALAIAFKQIAALDFAALCAYIIVRNGFCARALRELALAWAGMLLVLAAVIAPIVCLGVAPSQIWDCSVLLPFASSSRFRGDVSFIPDWSRWLEYAPFLFCAAFSLRLGWRRILPFWIWLAADFAGVNASGFYYPHQFRQIFPSLALLSGAGIGVLFEGQAEVWRVTAQRRLRAATIGILAVSALYAVSPFARYHCDVAVYRAALAVKNMTSPSDRVCFVDTCSGSAIFYSYAKRPAASRYSVATLGRENMVLRDFALHPPKVIVCCPDDSWIFNYAKNGHYIDAGRLEGYRLFIRR